jgi:hypothetical protein
MSQRQQNEEMQELKSTVTSEMNSIKDMLALALGSKQGRKPNQKGLFLTSLENILRLTHLLLTSLADRLSTGSIQYSTATTGCSPCHTLAVNSQHYHQFP